MGDVDEPHEPSVRRRRVSRTNALAAEIDRVHEVLEQARIGLERKQIRLADSRELIGGTRTQLAFDAARRRRAAEVADVSPLFRHRPAV